MARRYIGRRKAVEEAKAREAAAQQLADSIAPPADKFKTPVKEEIAKKPAKKKAPKKDQ